MNAVTLRAWEHRHNLLSPLRKASGHRLYTRAHIDLVNRIVGLLDRGMRISQVRAALTAGDRQSAAPAVVEDIWQRQLNGMIAAIIRFDQQGLERVYSEALSHYPVRDVTRKLLIPLLVELGKRWENGSGSVAEEHFFGFYLRNKLGARFHHRAQDQTGPRLLLASLPGDQHEIGLLLLALAATDADFRTVVLGANMPLEEFPAAVGKTGSDGIVLSGMIAPHSELLSEGLPQLVKHSPVPVFVGGSASVTHFDQLRGAGVVPLGNDIDTGLITLARQLDYTSG